MPICALFVIFDEVVNNPQHPETNTRLTLLDIAGGHFSRIEHTSEGTLPTSLLTEFSHIAREYVNDMNCKPSEQRKLGPSHPRNEPEAVEAIITDESSNDGPKTLDNGNDPPTCGLVEVRDIYYTQHS